MFKDYVDTTDEINAATPSRKGTEKIENILAARVIDAAVEVDRTLGAPGLLESLYEEALPGIKAALRLSGFALIPCRLMYR